MNAAGFYVYATCLNPNGKGGQILQTQCSNPERMRVVKMDVTNEEDIDRVLEEVKGDVGNNNGELWGLLNNAAIPRTGQIEWGDFNAHFRTLLNVNALGSIRVTRKFLPLLRQSHGRVLFMSSTASRYATIGHAAYSMAKASMLSFAETLRREVKRFGVQVAIITPMFYRTNIINADNTVKMLENMWDNTDKEVRRAYGERYFLACKSAIRWVRNFSRLLQITFVSSDIVSSGTVVMGGLRGYRAGG